MTKKRLIELLTILFILLGNRVYAEDHYVTQSGDGAHDGTTLLNAWSVSEFNNSSNWDTDYSSDDKIGPGDIVYFNGSINISTTPIYPAGSGNADHYITLDGTNATVTTQNGYYAIRIIGKNYFNIYGFDLESDVVTPTLNTGLSNNHAISIKAADYINVDDCEISQFNNAVIVDQGSHDITFTDNFIHENTESGIYVSNYGGYTSYNITVGGSSLDGNTFHNNQYKTVQSGNYVAYDVRISGSHYNIVISHNRMYADADSYRGMSPVLLHHCHHTLVEYNTMHGQNAANHRPGVSLKGGDDSTTPAHDIIIRYNHIYDRSSEHAYTNSRPTGINCSGNHYRLFIYGNYIHDLGLGISLNNGEWTDPSNTPYDGYDIYDEYVWSNVIFNTANGIWINGRNAGSNPDDFTNIHLVGNTIKDSYSDSYIFSSNIGVELTDNYIDNLYIRNNVLINGRLDATVKYNLYTPSYSDTYIDYNHYYATYGDANVYFDGTACDPDVWNSSSVPSGECEHASGGNPLLDSNLKISSSSSLLINSGLNLGNDTIGSITIQGTQYSLRLRDALSPQTDWTTVPPSIVTASQSDYGSGWERGAYVYEGTTPTVPTAPSGLSATTQSSSEIDLTWQDQSSDESGFVILRSTDGTNFSTIHTTSANVTSYDNTGLTASTTYYYRVYAYNAAGNSGYTSDNATTSPGGSSITETVGNNSSDDYSGTIDCYIHGGYPTTNYNGSDLKIEDDLSTAGAKHSLLAFDLSPFSGYTITRVRVGVYVYDPTETSVNIDLYNSDNNFTEAATWNTYNGSTSWSTVGSPEGDTQLESLATTSSTTGYIVFDSDDDSDLLSQANSDNGGYTYFVLAADDNTTQSLIMYSSEASDGYRPWIEVTYQASSSTAETVGNNSTDDYSGTLDCYIHGGNPTTNYNGTALQTEDDVSTSNAKHTLLAFDLSPFGNSTITRARVGVYVYDPAETSVNLNLYNSDNDFTEAATWNTYNGSTAWSTVGSPEGDTQLESLATTSSTTGYVVFDSDDDSDLLSQVNSDKGGYTYFVMVADAITTQSVIMYSSEASDGYRPWIEITYAGTRSAQIATPVIQESADSMELKSYPNPFNNYTTIQYMLTKPGNVSIEVYNTNGAKIKTLVQGNMQAGSYSAVWHGENNGGKPVPNGVYVCVMKANGIVYSTHKLVLVK